MTTSDASSPDPAETIAAALAQLRGRRGPRPPWAGGEDGDAPGRPPWGPGGRGFGGHHAHHGGRGADPRGGGWPEAMQARFGGPARLRLLEALVAASGPLSVSEIGEAIGVDQPRASRLVQQSVDIGLVRREADPDDARRTRIVLTDEGSAIVRSFRGDRREAVDRALAGFSDEERADLARLLAKFAAAWPR
ncbi:MarR family winged helix-turn-helix transcriptional regulator [Microbacterium sp. P01]|uniref:MarR family winged helix-turn-helix transcriptional regulator n=1 Tax=unclassified Microbacterium TaxID=2609290 RepID=UPI00366E7095